ncbi:hypothetical protein PU560_02710, partial [Georgenia sp. 10Sc9-8]|nr:hypothetical protein [Georgenia halotolerans]
GPELLTGAGGDALGLSREQLEDVEVGTPVAASTWAPGLLEGQSASPALVPLERWVAALTLERPPEEDEADAEGTQEDAAGPSEDTTEEDDDAADATAGTSTEAVVVGTLQAQRGEAGDVRLDRITAETELGEALHSRTEPLVLVRDEQTEGWFGYQDGTVRPLTEPAEEVLAGSVPLETYQPFLVERYSASQAGGPPPGTEEPDEAVPAPLWAAALLVSLLAITGTVVWLRRPEAGEHPAEDPLP